MILQLQGARRWPEPPVPNDVWKSFLRYLREQPTLDLNLAQGFMFSEATAYGMIPMDRPQNEDMRKTIEYLSSGPFRARNWFERTFGRVEPWMDYFVASRGYDMTPAAVSYTHLDVYKRQQDADGGSPRYMWLRLRGPPPSASVSSPTEAVAPHIALAGVSSCCAAIFAPRRVGGMRVRGSANRKRKPDSSMPPGFQGPG